MSDKNIPIEHDLIRDGVFFDDLEVVETKITPTVGNEDLHVEIVANRGDVADPHP